MPSLQSALEEIQRYDYPEEEPKIAFDLGNTAGPNKNYLAHLINVCADHSPIAKQILESALKEGYKLSMESMRDCAGITCSEDKIIQLNSCCDEGTLLATLIHECRHAEQNSKLPACDEMGHFDIPSEIMAERSMEADANAISLAACHEIAISSGDKSAMHSFIENDPEIYYGYMNKVSSFKDGPTSEAIQGAFLGWYTNGMMVDIYEDSYLRSRMNNSMRDSDFEKFPYNKHLTSEQIVTAFCTDGKGNCYWENDKDILSDRELLAVHGESMSVMNKFFKKREEKTGIAPDPEYKDLKVCDECEGPFSQLSRIFKKDYLKNFVRDSKNPIGLKSDTTSIEERRLNHMVNELCVDKENEKTLQSLKKSGYTVCFEPMNRNASALDHRRKKLVLNLNADDQTLQTSLIKETKNIQAYQAQTLLKTAGRSM